ncbi:PIG-L deacetylase family protein [Acidovorax sp. NCPPB 4044]|uniref:PIG-L deacetylase family protein n=1 Tax=Acidovorax sp. NCPPB 4044 TaxID=2940490 RepID=UPI00230323BD|nr:PIG-L family deacetylase [Acidovorax sp. NCPPB 4044]MDA8523231.1 PIG-L family deacetylase [Acidovorax sp. NCPPB 4044]
MDDLMDAPSGTRHIDRPRRSPQAWQSWLAALGPVCRPVSAVVGARQRLVVIAPHPDDEVLACGMLLRAHALQGGSMLVVGVTDGEASHRGDPGGSAVATAARRRQERSEGLRVLGAGAAELLSLGLPDGGLAPCRHGLEQTFRTLLRPGDVVVTTWRFDGHPDHEACGHAAAGAARAVGAALWEAPVWMWHWAEPEHSRIPWTRLAAFQSGGDAGATAKQAAIACHRSQLAERASGLPPVLDDAILERSRWPLEYFFAPGP